MVIFVGELATIRSTTFTERIEGGALTSLELLIAWGLVGASLFTIAARRRPARAP